MNIKIKASGVSCFIGNDYDRAYTALKKKLGQHPDFLFTERIPGHEYLQWVLPGEGWVALSEADPIIADEVRKKLHQSRQSVVAAFGQNTGMAERVLYVPDDSFIYYKTDGNGHISIKLTAWGYRYPERVDGHVAVGNVGIKKKTENTGILILFDGKPLPNKTIKLNGFNRTTNKEGRLDIGELPVGYQFDIDVDDIHRHVEVTEGNGQISIDCTRYVSVEVYTTRDDNPYANAEINVVYADRQQQTATDASGRATFTMPLLSDEEECTVTVDGEIQKKRLSTEDNVFTFSFTTPQPEVPETPGDNIVPPLVDPPLVPETPHEEENADKDKEEETVPPPVEEEKHETPPAEEPEKKSGNYVWGILMIILLALLTILTYIIGKGMLFG